LFRRGRFQIYKDSPIDFLGEYTGHVLIRINKKIEDLSSYSLCLPAPAPPFLPAASLCTPAVTAALQTASLAAATKGRCHPHPPTSFPYSLCFHHKQSKPITYTYARCGDPNTRILAVEPRAAVILALQPPSHTTYASTPPTI
jgi:hypothetical protein